MIAAAVLVLTGAVAGAVTHPEVSGSWAPITAELARQYELAARAINQPSRASVRLQRASSGAEWLDLGGDFTLEVDAFPRLDTTELRPELRVDLMVDPAPWIRIHVDAVAEGVVRELPDSRRRDFDGRVREAWVELMWNRADFRAGYGRLAWGRLDEVQPSDVINPLELRSFLLEGRSEGRLAVPLVRGRVFPVDGFSIEGVVVPGFRRGYFDRLDEPTSPFNLLNDVVLPAGPVLATTEIERREPDVRASSPLGGVRVSGTVGRVDLSGSIYRGADGFGVITFEPRPPVEPTLAVVGQLVETYSRFTMYATDFETVIGEWALRGELATFVDRQLQGVSVPGMVAGRSLDAGVGFDRRAGSARLYGTVLIHREWSDEDPSVDRTDVSVVGSIERRVARERHLLRAFAVVNPSDRTSFLRGLWIWDTTDNTALELSGGAFLGTGDDTLARFRDRDFVFGRFRYHF